MDVDGEKQLREQWQKLHEQRHVAEQQNISDTRTELSRRLNEMNEFRSQLAQERTQYVTRDWHERDRDALRGAMDTLGIEVDRRLKILENASSNWQGRWWAVGAIVALSIAVAGLVLRSMR